MAALKPTFKLFFKIKINFKLKNILKTLAFSLGCFPFDF